MPKCQNGSLERRVGQVVRNLQIALSVHDDAVGTRPHPPYVRLCQAITARRDYCTRITISVRAWLVGVHKVEIRGVPLLVAPVVRSSHM